MLYTSWFHHAVWSFEISWERILLSKIFLAFHILSSKNTSSTIKSTVIHFAMATLLLTGDITTKNEIIEIDDISMLVFSIALILIIQRLILSKLWCLVIRKTQILIFKIFSKEVANITKRNNGICRYFAPPVNFEFFGAFMAFKIFRVVKSPLRYLWPKQPTTKRVETLVR